MSLRILFLSLLFLSKVLSNSRLVASCRQTDEDEVSRSGVSTGRWVDRPPVLWRIYPRLMMGFSSSSELLSHMDRYYFFLYISYICVDFLSSGDFYSPLIRDITLVYVCSRRMYVCRNHWTNKCHIETCTTKYLWLDLKEALHLCILPELISPKTRIALSLWSVKIYLFI